MKTLTTSLRLRIAWFFFGMMFFYGIEQLFLDKVIMNSSARGYVTAIYTLSLVVFDIPTGMLADRISRKLCLILASVVQILALLILGFSTTVVQYVIGSFIFGIFICLTNGSAQAILYDWLASRSLTAKYASEQGRDYAAFLIGAGIANLASGFIANALSLRTAYFLSIIPAILALLILLGLEDPPYAKKQATLWYKQLGEVAREIIRHRKIFVFSIHFIAAALVLYTFGEFGQIYMLTFGVSTTTLGIFWAISALFAAGGRALAHRAQKYPRLLISVFCLVAFVFTLIHHRFGIAVFWLLYGLNEAITNVSETEIQHATSSHVRATTLSVVSFVGNVLAIPVVLLYNHLYLQHGVIKANQTLLVSIVILLLITLLVRSTLDTKQASSRLPTKPTAI